MVRYHDPRPRAALCVSAQRFYELNSLSTEFLATSFTPVDKVRALTGVQHLTLLPQSPRQLAESSVSQQMPALWFHVAERGPVQAPKLPLEDREGLLTGLKNGDGEERLNQVGFNEP